MIMLIQPAPHTIATVIEQKPPMPAITEIQRKIAETRQRIADYPMPVDPYKTALVTADGAPITNGMRLFNYYDRKWGEVTYITDRDGWFTLRQDDGSAALLNGPRVSTQEVK